MRSTTQSRPTGLGDMFDEVNEIKDISSGVDKVGEVCARSRDVVNDATFVVNEVGTTRSTSSTESTTKRSTISIKSLRLTQLIKSSRSTKSTRLPRSTKSTRSARTIG